MPASRGPQKSTVSKTGTKQVPNYHTFNKKQQSILLPKDINSYKNTKIDTLSM
jgi:hypothetical protein